MPDLIRFLFASEEIRYLVALVAANVVLGIVASIKSGDFRLVLVADWLTKRVLPLVAGYGSAALLAWANPDLTLLRDAAFATLVLALLGYVLSSLAEMGVPIPDVLAGRKPDVLAGSKPVQPVEVVPPGTGARV